MPASRKGHVYSQAKRVAPEEPLLRNSFAEYLREKGPDAEGPKGHMQGGVLGAMAVYL